MPKQRRHRLDLMKPSEKAIYDAMQEVEKIGADTRLTEAVVKLQEAKNLVSNYLDETETNDTTDDPTEGDTGGSNPPPGKERP